MNLMPLLSRLQSRRLGFSLIEMLVVVTLLTILLALLMPAMAASRARARQLMCASNLRSQNTAIVSYVQDDNRRSLPYGVTFSSSWMIRISSYLGGSYNTQMQTTERYNANSTLSGWNDAVRVDSKIAGLLCPESKLAPRSNYYSGTYGYNGWVASGAVEILGGVHVQHHPESQRRYSAIRGGHDKLILASDSAYYVYPYGSVWDGVLVGLASGRFHPNGSQKTVNMMVLDGHVEACTNGDYSKVTMFDPG